MAAGTLPFAGFRRRNIPRRHTGRQTRFSQTRSCKECSEYRCRTGEIRQALASNGCLDPALAPTKSNLRVAPTGVPARRARSCRPGAGRRASALSAVSPASSASADAAPCRRTNTPATWHCTYPRPAPAAACGSSANPPGISAAHGCDRGGRTRAVTFASQSGLFLSATRHSSCLIAALTSTALDVGLFGGGLDEGDCRRAARSSD